MPILTFMIACSITDIGMNQISVQQYNRRQQIRGLKLSDTLYLQATHQESNMMWKMDALIHTG